MWMWLLVLPFIGSLGIALYSGIQYLRLTKPPKLALSKPVLVPDQSATCPAFPYSQQPDKYTVDLYRLAISNVQRDSEALNVQVKLTLSRPDLTNILPVSLHETHNDTPPYKTSRSLGYGAPLLIDVVAKDKAGSRLFLYRSDLPYIEELGGDQYVFPIPPSSVPDMAKASFFFRVSVYADSLGSPTERDYRVFIDAAGEFKMEPIPSQTYD